MATTATTPASTAAATAASAMSRSGTPPSDEPPVVPALDVLPVVGCAGPTVAVAFATADRPSESVTDTVTSEEPAAVGVQRSTEVFWLEHPAGRPV